MSAEVITLMIALSFQKTTVIFNLLTQNGILPYWTCAYMCIFGAGGSVSMYLQHCEPDSERKNLKSIYCTVRDERDENV